MNEDTIRKRLRAAFGESTYPPDLSSRAAARLGAPAVQQQSSSWVLAVAAAVLAIALVATIVFGARAFRPRATVPVQPPPTQVPSSNACPNFSQLNQPLSSVKMSSPSTGWASGGLRTTDGGALWKDTSPAALRDGLPAPAIANGLYPPGFKDFYLDAGHAWEFRIYASSTSCEDHAEIFSTSDGGHSWQPSQTLSFGLPAGWGAAVLDFQFIDFHHGWLWTEAGPIEQTSFGPAPVVQQGDLYDTVDGGITWRLVSTLKPSQLGFASSKDCPFALGPVTFASSTSGWMAINCPSSPALLVSSDGGVTWTLARLPKPATSTNCPCQTQLPRFFDATHGVVEVDGNYADYNPLIPTPLQLLATSDGGVTWQAVPAGPATGFTLVLDFVDATNWWEVVTEPGWQKGQPTNDWLYRTADGGQTWALVQKDLPMGYPPPDLVFLDSLHGLAVQDQNATGALLGPGTEVLTTSDGGHTWKSTVAQISAP
jgi:photosystem II stability/assembly factor-like uncharacterized protein